MNKKEKEFLDKRMKKGISLPLSKIPGVRLVLINEKELFEALEEIEAKAWYNRNKKMQQSGGIKREQMPGVIKTERELEKKFGFDNLNKDYDDFEWGNLMGKLETLRWILGCEWGSFKLRKGGLECISNVKKKSK